MEIGVCIRLLVERAKELDRLPIKSDFDAETVNRIKKALGPWPRALEKAGLKPVPKRIQARQVARRKGRRKAKGINRISLPLWKK